MARKPTDTAHLNLRYPEALRRRLERAAKNSSRSLNSEIVERLEQSFRREDFEKLQDAMTWGMLKVMRVAADVTRYLPRGSPWLRESELAKLSDDELAKRIAEAEAAEGKEQSK